MTAAVWLCGGRRRGLSLGNCLRLVAAAYLGHGFPGLPRARSIPFPSIPEFFCPCCF